ncbi:MAG: mobile mystery protein B [Candidatus Margulisiibacteriota bacterium]|nr:MAG: hypothetical protein A2X41_02095 [Candidatus Margulisbacteria bacterium GWE2_39_32]PZM80170.1 MAG: mobile mystery protein B [Candidatus Margulisiibacteriota bacterium]HCT84913.1 mobile mystery protein B [Candidatus Margulisiibacteriota bacterium]HCY35587.1 mobile mystery protein B [Candidatus Margulisiibacteriota bacterium]
MVILKGNSPYGATPIDDYSGLKLKHINTIKELYEAEFLNITSSTSKYLLKPPSNKSFMDRIYLFKIHKTMFSQVWDWAGKKRISNKSVGIDKFQIDIEIVKLIQDFEFWESSNMDTIEVSSRIHHKLVYIHPFENGNGRWARLVTNIYLKQKLNRIVYWPEQELYINNVFRKRYIHSLQSADHGNFADLVSIHQELLEDIIQFT